MELEEDKKDLERRIRIHEARSFEDQNIKLLYPSSDRIRDEINIEEHLLRIDNDKTDTLNKKLKKKLSIDEYNKIVDDINKLNKSKIKRIQEIDIFKKK